MRLTPAVLRACDIIDYLAGEPGTATIAALSHALAIPRNTTYELVNTLAARRLVEVDPDGRVSLGLHVFELGNVYARSLDLLTEARPIIREVARTCNETTHLAILDGMHVVYLVKEETTQSIGIRSMVGGRIAAHATAVGKAMLAFRPRDETVRRLDGVVLEKLTPNTITDLDVLFTQLDVALQRGYTTDDEESSPEVACVAAPIWDRTGQVVAAMSISAPKSRMTMDRPVELAHLVVSAAARLSHRLGYLPATRSGLTVPAGGLLVAGIREVSG